MIAQLVIAVLLGILGSYYSFFAPKFLSKNIIELSSASQKWIASVISVIVPIGLFIQINPKTDFEWIEYGFMIVFYFISVIDLYAKIIPNRLVLLLLGISVLKLALHFDLDLPIAAGVIFILFTIANLSINKFFKKILFGWGDVKLIGVISLYLGWEVVWVIYSAIILAGLLSIFGIFANIFSRSTKIPIAIFYFIGFQKVSIEFMHINFIANFLYKINFC